MSPRLSIVAGLVVGVAVAGLLLGGIVALTPDPVSPSAPVPSFAIDSAEPSIAASAGPGASGSAGPGGSGALFHVGEPAPALLVPQVGGGMIDLAALRGKPVWINFMATWCPPCQDEFPLMNGFAARYGDKGLVVIAVDVKEEEGTVAAFGTELDVTFPTGLDLDGKASESWDAIALPVHYWIDADGIVRDGALGGIGPDIMAAGLTKILPGVDVTP
jgi:thiol-disulfide isomerase/thioredoxin